MLNQNSQKMSFEIKLPHDPKSKCNKFITKGYSMCVCLMNIAIKISITLGIILILLSQMNPPKRLKTFTQSNITNHNNT